MIWNLRNFSFLHSPIDRDRFRAYYLNEKCKGSGNFNDYENTISEDQHWNGCCYGDEYDDRKLDLVDDNFCDISPDYRPERGADVRIEDDDSGNIIQYRLNKNCFCGENISDVSNICCSSLIGKYRSKQSKKLNPRDLIKHMTCYPGKLNALIKQETMNGDAFVICIVWIGSMIQNHLLIKSLIQLFWVGYDREREIFLNSLYYPNLAGASDKPAIYQPTLMAHIFFDYIFWHLNLYRLTRKSIANRTYYKELSLSQINLAYLASFQWTFLIEFRNTSLALIKYVIMIFRDRKIYDLWETGILERFVIRSDKSNIGGKDFHKRYSVDASSVGVGCHQSNINLHDNPSWLKHMMFVENPIDYTPNFQVFKSTLSREQQKSFFKLKNPQTNSRLWQVAKPLHRVDVDRLGLVILLMQFFTFSHIIGCTYYLIGMSALEFTSRDIEESMKAGLGAIGMKRDHRLDGDSSDHLSSFILVFMKPHKLIRLIENLIFYLTLVIPQLSSMSFCIDGIIFVSRVESVWRLAKHQVKLITDARHHSDREARDWSAQMQHLIQLVRLVAYEFNDVKREHIVPIHLLVMSSCIIVPQLCSLILVSDNIWEEAILVGGLVNMMVPIFTVVAISGAADLFVSNLIAHDLVNLY